MKSFYNRSFLETIRLYVLLLALCLVIGQGALAAGSCSKVYEPKAIEGLSIQYRHAIKNRFRASPVFSREVIQLKKLIQNDLETADVSQKSELGIIHRMLNIEMSMDSLWEAVTRYLRVIDQERAGKTYLKEWMPGNGLAAYVKKEEVLAITFPVVSDLNHRDIMWFYSEGFLPMGVIGKPLKADGVMMSPTRFADHDMQHAGAWMTAVETKAKNLNISSAEVLRRYKAFSRQVLSKIEKVRDPAEQARLDFLWFYLGHEQYLVPLSASEFPRQAYGYHHRAVGFESESFLKLAGRSAEEWDASWNRLLEIVGK